MNQPEFSSKKLDGNTPRRKQKRKNVQSTYSQLVITPSYSQEQRGIESGISDYSADPSSLYSTKMQTPKLKSLSRQIEAADFTENSVSLDVSSSSESVSLDLSDSSSSYTNDPTIDNINPLIRKALDSGIKPTEHFKQLSLALSIIRSINMFRESSKRQPLQNDDFLCRVAINHSIRMAIGEIELGVDGLDSFLAGQPYAFYQAHCTKYDTLENAFINVVNHWTSDKIVSKSLLTNFNVIGVGMSVSERHNNVYFTLILGMRSLICSSICSGSYLKSTILSYHVIRELNFIRTNEFNLRPSLLEPSLCEIAYEFCKKHKKEITAELVREKLGVIADYAIGFSITPFCFQPLQIVENWMNQIGKSTTVLGDFNRIGVGFVDKKDKTYGVRVLVRSNQAAVADGTETIIDGSILAHQIGEIMNNFRDQHALAAMDFDDDLFSVAQEHSEYVANGMDDENPLESERFLTSIQPQFEAIDISHLCCNEISRAPQAFMSKWRNNADCISVLLNQVDSLGVGVCFDNSFICHITVVIASRGIQKKVVNKIVRL